MGRRKKLPTDGLQEEDIVHLINIPTSRIIASGDIEYIKREFRWWLRNGYSENLFAVQTFNKLFHGTALQTWLTQK